MMVNLGAAVNVVQGIRSHTAQHTGNPDRAASLSLLITPAHPMTTTREGDLS